MMKQYKMIWKLVWVLALVITACENESTTEQAALNVGDKVPQEVIKQITGKVTGPKKYIKAEEERKFLLLHFWNTSCPTSTASLVAMKKLQDQFAPYLSILMVNNTETWLQADNKLKTAGKHMPDMLYLNGMPRLAKLFPHAGVPFDVWINGDDQVVARTSWDYVTPESIRRVVIKREKVHMYEHKYLPENEIKEPLLTGNDNVLEDEPLYYSAITPKRKGAGAGTANNKGSHMLYNQSIASLYASAFKIPMPLEKTRIVYKLPDSIKTIVAGPQRGSSIESLNRYYEWAEDHSYCYNSYYCEQGLPTAWKRRSNRKVTMQNDLNNYFGLLLGIEGTLGKVKIPCFVITTAGHTGNTVKSSIKNSQETTSSSAMIAAPTFVLENKLRAYGKPVILDVADEEEPNLAMSANIQTLEGIRMVLKKRGLVMKEEISAVDVLVIKEK